MIKKWKKIKEVPYQTEYRKISKVTYRLPNNKLGNFDIIKSKDTACIVALTSDKKVIIAKQYRPGPKKILYELPAGAIEQGEKPIDGARRELLEETGYTGKIQFIGKSYRSAYREGKTYSFVALDCKKIKEPQLDEKEFIHVELVSLKKFREILKKGLGTDIGAAYQVLDYLKLL